MPPFIARTGWPAAILIFTGTDCSTQAEALCTSSKAFCRPRFLKAEEICPVAPGLTAAPLNKPALAHRNFLLVCFNVGILVQKLVARILAPDAAI